MAWSDEPTYNQIETLFRWMKWHMTNSEAVKASHWLKEHATRKEVSDEIKRVHDLYYEHKLDKDNCFDSSVWEDYNPDEYEFELPSSPRVIVDTGE